MHQEIIYIKLKKDVEVTKPDVFFHDMGSVYCENDTVVNKCKALKIGTFRKDEKRKVISVMKVIEMISGTFPKAEIVNTGETDVIVELVKTEKKGVGRRMSQIIFVSLISFFGTAFTIMAFHNDIQIQELFNDIHVMVTGKETSGHGILELSYSLGLGVGIIVFFNHIGGKRISSDPTPIEVEMRIYEDDVNRTLIDYADRLNQEVEAKE